MQDLSETGAQITQQLGLDAGGIEARQRFLEFDAAGIARPKQAHSLTKDQRDEFAVAFYAYLLKFAPLQHLLADEATLARLKRAQAGYFSHFGNSQWLWGAKLSYNYLGAEATSENIAVPQDGGFTGGNTEIGRASCRERVLAGV